MPPPPERAGAADESAPAPRPDDLAALTLAELAAAGNFAAVAVAARPQLLSADVAFQTLAEHADNPDAAVWLWALLPHAPNPSFWSVLGRVPQGHRPTAEVQPAVREFILTPQATAGVQDPLAGYRAALLARLDPTAEFTLALARSVVQAQLEGAGLAPAGAVLQGAVGVLVASTNPDDRDLLLDLAGRPGADSNPVIRPDAALALLWQLEPPYREVETRALLAVVHAVLAELPAGPADATQLRKLTELRALLGRLPDTELTAALDTSALAAPGPRQQLLGGGALVHALSGETRTRLIKSAGAAQLRWSHPLIDELLADTVALSDPGAGNLAEFAHRHLPGRRLQPLRQRYLAAAQPDQGHAGRSRAQAILLRCALAVPPAGTEPPDQDIADQVLRDASDAHAAGELQHGSAVFLEPANRQRLGRLLALRYAAAAAGEHATDTGNEIFGMLHPLDHAGQAQLLAGLLSRPLPDGLLPEPVIRQLSTNPIARRVLLRYGDARQLIDAQAAPADPYQVLTDLVTADDPAAQPEVVPAPNQAAPPPSDLEFFTRSLDWADLEQTGQRPQAITVLSARPRLLEVALTQQIHTLSGAAADAAPPDRLAALLDEYLNRVATGQMSCRSTLSSALLTSSCCCPPATRGCADGRHAGWNFCHQRPTLLSSPGQPTKMRSWTPVPSSPVAVATPAGSPRRRATGPPPPTTVPRH